MGRNKIVGLICSILGGVVALFSLITISGEQNRFFGGYTYSAPYSGHEIMMLTILGISVISLIVGIVLLINKSNNGH